MLSLFIFLLFITLKTEARDPDNSPTEVTFNIQADSSTKLITCDHKYHEDIKQLKKYTVLEGGQIKLIAKSNFHFNHFFCSDYSNAVLKNVTKNYDFEENIITRIFQAEKTRGTLWNCTVLINRDVEPGIPPVVEYEGHKYTATYCHMKIHVRQEKSPQTILVNNMALPAVRTDLSDKDIDFAVEYQYADGDVVNVICANLNTTAPLMVEYAVADKLSDKFNSTHLSSDRGIGFIATLRSEHNNTYMICTNAEPTDYTKLKVVFVMRTEFNIVGITINEMIMRPKLSFADNTRYYIEYKYLSHQDLDVLCEVNRTGMTLVVSGLDNFADKVSRYNENTDYKATTQKTEISFSLQPENDMELSCSTEYVSGSTETGTAENVTIHFNAADNLLKTYQLHMEMSSNRTVTELYNLDKLKVIFYEFVENDTLELNCSTRSPAAGPVLYVQLKDSEVFKSNDSAVLKTLTVTSKDDNTEIACYLKEQHNSKRSKEDEIRYEIRVILRMIVPDPENPAILLDYSHDTNENYTVLVDKPLMIIIRNAYARYAWCVGMPFNNIIHFVPETECNNTDSDVILNINNVKDEMSTGWECKVLQEYHGPPLYRHKDRDYTAKDLHFDLHVKGARSVIVTTNNRIMTFVTTNLSVNYDGDANYTYEDGEEVILSCIGTDRNESIGDVDFSYSFTSLEYYNAEGVLLVQTKPQTKLTFRSVLKSKNNSYYLDCILTKLSLNGEYRYRTTFYMKKPDFHAGAVQQAMILSVDGQNLTTVTNIDQSSDSYTFSYIDGEVLNVTCRKMDNNIKGTLLFYFNGRTEVHLDPVLRSLEEEMISLNVPTLKLKYEHLTCSINNTEIQKPNTTLLLTSDVPFMGVRIRGLPRNNILYQYTSDSDQWTIEYQYSVNDTLNLTCVSRGYDPDLRYQWIFEDKITETPAMGQSQLADFRWSKKNFTIILDATHNENKIQCVTAYLYFVKVEIILRLKPELDLEAESGEVTSGNRLDILVYCGSAMGVGSFLVFCYLVTKKCGCTNSSRPVVATNPPAPPFYLNLLSVFRQYNEEEAAQINDENIYEEINDPEIINLDAESVLYDEVSL